jgi:hypothetical protein
MAAVLTNAGCAILTSRLKGVGTEPRWIGVGTGAGTAAKADTTLFSETGSRFLGISTSISGTYQVVGTFTATSTVTISNAGLFTASTSGNLFIKMNFTPVALTSGDSLVFTFTLTGQQQQFGLQGTSSLSATTNLDANGVIA